MFFINGSLKNEAIEAERKNKSAYKMIETTKLNVNTVL